jgi:hypothetical protein
MDSLLKYLLETALWQATLYAFYLLAMRKEPFMKINRAFLILSPIVSLVAPLIKFDSGYVPAFIPREVMLRPIIVGSSEDINKITSSDSGINYYLLIYLAGILFFAVKFGYGIFRLQRMRRESISIKSESRIKGLRIKSESRIKRITLISRINRIIGLHGLRIKAESQIKRITQISRINRIIGLQGLRIKAESWIKRITQISRINRIMRITRIKNKGRITD